MLSAQARLRVWEKSQLQHTNKYFEQRIWPRLAHIESAVVFRCVVHEDTGTITLIHHAHTHFVWRKHAEKDFKPKSNIIWSYWLHWKSQPIQIPNWYITIFILYLWFHLFTSCWYSFLRWSMLVDNTSCIQTEVRRWKSKGGRWPDSSQCVVGKIFGEWVFHWVKSCSSIFSLSGFCCLELDFPEKCCTKNRDLSYK